MQIAEKKVAKIHYTLKSDDGEVIDSSQGKDPLEYLHGVGNLVPGLEAELEGRSAGDELEVRIAPEQGYGLRDDERMHTVGRDRLPEGDIQEGMQVQAFSEEGVMVLTIAKIDGDTITLDANHPLAGVHLNFAVTVVEVREATPEELEHGHSHGPGGHEH